MRTFVILTAVLLAWPTLATERSLNFGDYPLDQTPSNFLSTVAGRGKPGDWKIILDEAPSAMPSRNPNAPSMTKRSVLAQLDRDAINEHFPILLLNEDTFDDFTFTTRFKIVGGAMAEMAGIVFRYQDPKNYYVLMASALDNRFWFFKVVDGQRGKLFGPQVEISRDQWHELSVQCEGNHIHCLLDGKELIPMLTDSSFTTGKIGFWTKSDSVSYFTDARITYTPRETGAQAIVHDALVKFPKLVGLKIFATRPGASGPVVIAGNDEKQINQPAGDIERDVIAHGKSYYGKNKKAGTVTLTVPLRDRNGEPIAAAAITMKTFPGETQDTAALRSQTVVQTMQPRISSLDDLIQ